MKTCISEVKNMWYRIVGNDLENHTEHALDR